MKKTKQFGNNPKAASQKTEVTEPKKSSITEVKTAPAAEKASNDHGAPTTSTKKTKSTYTPKCALNLRKAPDKSAPIVRVLVAGEQLNVVKDLGEWLELADGFCLKTFVEVK